jgi:hypothetical protein
MEAMTGIHEIIQRDAALVAQKITGASGHQRLLPGVKGIPLKPSTTFNRSKASAGLAPSPC